MFYILYDLSIHFSH
ncbi:unnamed protein product, partial [Oppiella nova]